MSKEPKNHPKNAAYPRNSVAALDAGQLDLMFQFLQIGAQKSDARDIHTLKYYLDQLRQALIQKSAGQRKEDPAYYVDFNDLGTIVNIIVCETMSLYLSGALDKLDALLSKEAENKNGSQE